jgi:hypothetical protein
VAAEPMTWDEVLGLPRSGATLESTQVRILSQRLVALSLEQAYIQGPIKQIDGTSVLVEPREAIWATSDEVAMAIENPNRATAPSIGQRREPPVELCPSARATYREITSALSSMGVNAIESAIYSRLGRFVMRSVLGGGGEYFFASNERSDEELPVAIARRFVD